MAGIKGSIYKEVELPPTCSKAISTSQRAAFAPATTPRAGQAFFLQKLTYSSTVLVSYPIGLHKSNFDQPIRPEFNELFFKKEETRVII